MVSGLFNVSTAPEANFGHQDTQTKSRKIWDIIKCDVYSFWKINGLDDRTPKIKVDCSFKCVNISSFDYFIFNQNSLDIKLFLFYSSHVHFERQCIPLWFSEPFDGLTKR